MSEDRLFLPSFHDLEKTLKRLQPRDRMRMRTMLDRDLQELRSELSDAREDDVAALVNGDDWFYLIYLISDDGPEGHLLISDGGSPMAVTPLL